MKRVRGAGLALAPPLMVIWVTVTARTLRHCAQTGMGFRGAESCTLRRTNGHLTSSPIALSSTLSSWRLFQVVLWPPLSPILPICGMSLLKRSPKICVPDRTATCRGEYSIGLRPHSIRWEQLCSPQSRDHLQKHQVLNMGRFAVLTLFGKRPMRWQLSR